LAKKVLEGQTKGYKNHSQLERFKNTHDPISYINYYLSGVFDQASMRKYKYDESKIDSFEVTEGISVNHKQVIYEFNFLQDKLFSRDIKQWKINESYRESGYIILHPLFYIKLGEIESWEKVK